MGCASALALLGRTIDWRRSRRSCLSPAFRRGRHPGPAQARARSQRQAGINPSPHKVDGCPVLVALFCDKAGISLDFDARPTTDSPSHLRQRTVRTTQGERAYRRPSIITRPLWSPVRLLFGSVLCESPRGDELFKDVSGRYVIKCPLILSRVIGDPTCRSEIR